MHQGPGEPLETAVRLLDRLQVAAEEGGRTGTLIEILALQALAHGEHQVPVALSSLERALRLAEHEGYVRVFVGEGTRMALLLEALARREPSWRYPLFLLARCEGRQTARVEQGLLDPLSERELDVLRLLATDLDGPEIARRLFISVNTVRTHTKNIYAKLSVQSRRAAVTRARELGLI
jgi:LuxR family maltose regulon positive regulatory protein